MRSWTSMRCRLFSSASSCASAREIEEAARLLSLVAAGKCVRSELRKVFDLVDRNGDEWISRDEMRSLVSSVSIDDKEMGLLFKQSAERIDFDSFCEFVLDAKNFIVSAKILSTCRVLFVCGGPGSGKGTICGLMSKKNPQLVHVSSGDLLRDEMRRGTPLGKSLQDVIARGELVSAAVVMTLVEQSIQRVPAHVVLLDGFPRSLENLNDFLTVYNNRCDGVLYFDCPEEEMIKRIMARGLTSGRADDLSEATARRRVQVFREQSSAPIARLRELGFPFTRIDSTLPAQQNADMLLQMPLFKPKT